MHAARIIPKLLREDEYEDDRTIPAGCGDWGCGPPRMAASQHGDHFGWTVPDSPASSSNCGADNGMRAGEALREVSRAANSMMHGGSHPHPDVSQHDSGMFVSDTQLPRGAS